MSTRFTRADKAVLQTVEELLWREWDPIGCGVPRDEYDSYAMQAYARALRGENVEQIARYLTDVETQAMGLSPCAGQRERNLHVAEKVVGIVTASTRT